MELVKMRKNKIVPPNPDMEYAGSVVSTNDFTGMIPNGVVGESEIDAYEELKNLLPLKQKNKAGSEEK